MNQSMLRRLGDAGLAAALASVAIVEIWLPLPSAQGHGSSVLSTVVAVILCLMLALRRRWPLATAIVVMLTWPLAFSIEPILILFWGQLVPIVVAAYSVARYARPPRNYLGAVTAAGCLIFFDLRVAELQDLGEVVFHWLAVSLAWVIGTVVARAEVRATQSRRRALQAEINAATAVLAALATERARIARELHDIVAHAVSMMTVQAGAAEQVVTEDPAFTAAALATIRATGSAALEEMRLLVTVLREDGVATESADAAAVRPPQPGIGNLPALVSAAREDGLSVELTVTGPDRALPAGLDLTAYRIVQESLTNVRKHAGATTARVTLAFADAAVRITVVDDGAGDAHGHGALERRGHGIIGMRERAALYGGTLETSTGPGFTVTASLPISAELLGQERR